MAAPYSIYPTPPDFHVCDRFFGIRGTPIDCNLARNRLPSLSTPVVFNVGPSDSLGVNSGSATIPSVISYGQCAIIIEAAGPNLPPTMAIVPNDIRGMVGLLINECVVNSGGLGGFVTRNISNLLDFLNSGPNGPTLLVRNYPTSSVFLTVSLTTTQLQRPNPGNFDPSIAGAISAWAFSQYLRTRRPVTSVSNWIWQSMCNEFSRKVADMSRGGSTPWWRNAQSAPDEMTYQCDTNLGSPQTADCAEVEYQLDASSDTIQIAAGEVKFLSSNTCHVSISSATNVILTSLQLRAALSTLYNLCVSNPLLSSRGGRAHYGQGQTITTYGGRRRKRQANTVTGENALPPGTNLSIFAQPEPWQPDPALEIKTCTYQAVANGANVAPCGNAKKAKRGNIRSILFDWFQRTR